MKFEPICLKGKLLPIKEFHRTAAILSAILKIMNRRKLNFELIRDIDKTDACMKFEQNLLREKKAIACQRISIWTDRANTIGPLPTVVGRAIISFFVSLIIANSD